MQDPLKHLKQFDDLASGKAAQWILDHVPDLFRGPDIKSAHQYLKDVRYQNPKLILIQSWLALLAGDNLKLVSLAAKLDESMFDDNYTTFYLDLQALSGVFHDVEERLKCAERAIAILPAEEPSFIAANAYLTRGQVYAGVERHRDAARDFEEAYRLFVIDEIWFPAAVAMSNAMLNLYRLGEFRQLEELMNRASLVGSVFQGQDVNYWNVIDLPHAMMLAEQGKYALAYDAAMRAKRVIDDLELVHMHGYIEVTLFRILAIRNNPSELKRLVDQTDKMFASMRYPMMDVIVTFGRERLGDKPTTDDIERMEQYYFKTTTPMHPLLPEVLMWQLVQGNTKQFTEDDLLERIKHYRYIGDVPSLARSILFLAEIRHRAQKREETETLLREYHRLYRSKGIIAPLHQYRFTCLDVLRGIDPGIPLPARPTDALTPKELEILKLIAAGHTNKEIASELFVTVGTVKWHINNVYSKLQVGNRVEAVTKASAMNMI